MEHETHDEPLSARLASGLRDMEASVAAHLDQRLAENGGHVAPSAHVPGEAASKTIDVDAVYARWNNAEALSKGAQR
jgi:hypothetical protein